MKNQEIRYKQAIIKIAYHYYKLHFAIVISKKYAFTIFFSGSNSISEMN